MRPGPVLGQSHRDVSTLTDLCSGVDLPEVEIVSLLTEKLPKYTLRADHVFGYEHDDWLHTPLLPPDATLGLTYEQIDETLKYFLLCSERVGQVTKTYHDIEAVTNLLEEKERDLELAARIGQSLLIENKSLKEHNELLDEQLEIAREEIAQLRHELSMRDDLLQLYASTEETEPALELVSPIRRNESSTSLTNYVHYDLVQQKLKGLEEENYKLRSEASELTSETLSYEEKEQQLMMVCVEELSSVNKQVVALSEELARKVEDSLRQQEEISCLLAQVVDLQQRCKGVIRENEELTQHLTASRESQTQLRTELKDLQERHSECEDMLQEAREEIKNLRNKALPNSTVQRYSSLSAVFPINSLAAEIEGTFRKGLDSPAPSEYKSHPLRVFETVKVANQAARLRSRCHSPQIPGSGSGSSQSSHTSTPRTSFYGSDSVSVNLEDKHLPSTPSQEQSCAQSKRLGQPGMPGGQDLEEALRSLSARQESHCSEQPFFEVERERKLRALGANGSSHGSSGFLTPNDSVVSTGTNYSGSSQHSSGSSSSRSGLPERLQIVKPLEGSVTLHHWQQLAKPNLGGILQPRPGVLTKDFRELDVDMQHVYSLNDLEEDELDLSRFPNPSQNAMATLPESKLPHTCHIHTITSTQISHPFFLLSTFSSSLRPRSLSACGSCEHIKASHLQQCLAHHGLFHRTALSTMPSLGLLHVLEKQDMAQPSPPPSATAALKNGEQSGGQKHNRNTFSLNLVEKLRSLGLHRVVRTHLAWCVQLARVLVDDYCTLVPCSVSTLQNICSASPRFCCQLITAITALYDFSSDELSPPSALLEMVVGWITEDPRLLLITFINTPLTSNLPIGCLEVTPLMGLLRWCVKAPLAYQRGQKSSLSKGHAEMEKGAACEELYSKLHLCILQVFLMLQVHLTEQNLLGRLSVLQVESAAALVEEVSRFGDELNPLHSVSHVQLALDRLAQALQVAMATGALLCTREDLRTLCSRLPHNNLMHLVMSGPVVQPPPHSGPFQSSLYPYVHPARASPLSPHTAHQAALSSPHAAHPALSSLPTHPALSSHHPLTPHTTHSSLSPHAFHTAVMAFPFRPIR